MEKCAGCAGRKKQRSERERRSLITRLNRIEGQIGGIRRMVEEDVYCADILTQTAAVSAAVNAFCRELLRAHISTCVVEDIKSGREDTVDELMDVLRRMMK